jgi:hypothetical protein
MNYIKSKILIIYLFMSSVMLFSVSSLQDIDTMYHDGKYSEGLDLLLKMHDEKKPDAAIIWRISRMYYEIADVIQISDKKEKISQFTKGMNISEKFLNIKEGEKLDRAQLIFWYAANLGARGQTIGIKESLDSIPGLFDLAEKAIAIDPTYAAPYLLKGRIDDAVPFFLGGDKFRMGINLTTAVKLYPDELNVLVDSAGSFIRRNWSVNKKLKLNIKYGKTDGTPENLTDKQYANILLEDAVKSYLNIKNPSLRDKQKYNETLRLLKMIK